MSEAQLQISGRIQTVQELRSRLVGPDFARVFAVSFDTDVGPHSITIQTQDKSVPAPWENETIQIVFTSARFWHALVSGRRFDAYRDPMIMY